MDIDTSKPIFVTGDKELLIALKERLSKNGFDIHGEDERVKSLSICEGHVYSNSYAHHPGYQTVNVNQHWPELRELDPVSKGEWEVKKHPFLHVTNGVRCISTISPVPLKVEQATKICDALNGK